MFGQFQLFFLCCWSVWLIRHYHTGHCLLVGVCWSHNSQRWSNYCQAAGIATFIGPTENIWRAVDN